MNVIRAFLYSTFLTIAFSSCRQMDVFEKNTPIPGHRWKSSAPIRGSFVITDTTAYYNIFVVIRHTDAYKYNNIWLNAGLQAPGDTMSFQKLNIGLSDDANGWYGSGMDDIWEVRNMISREPRKFSKPGTYHYELYQIMRDNPLPEIMSAGIRVEIAEED